MVRFGVCQYAALGGGDNNIIYTTQLRQSPSVPAPYTCDQRLNVWATRALEDAEFKGLQVTQSAELKIVVK
jgi:hypothetical protein